jgi:hypothetical protein
MKLHGQICINAFLGKTPGYNIMNRNIYNDGIRELGITSINKQTGVLKIMRRPFVTHGRKLNPVALHDTNSGGEGG